MNESSSQASSVMEANSSFLCLRPIAVAPFFNVTLSSHQNRRLMALAHSKQPLSPSAIDVPVALESINNGGVVSYLS